MSIQREEQARLWDQVAFLRQTIETQTREIEAWIDEAKRKDMLLAHLQERVVELPTGAPEPQDGTQMYRVEEPVRPWRRWLGL